MLVPTLYYCLAEEQSGEWNGVKSASPSGLEIILKLLVEAVAIHMQVLKIEVGELSFEGLFAKTGP